MIVSVSINIRGSRIYIKVNIEMELVRALTIDSVPSFL